MVDPLSSLSLEAVEADLPGYISAGDSSAYPSDDDSESDEEDVGQSSQELHHSNRVNEENRLMSPTPPSVNWNEVVTPELKMRQIRQYEQYVALRIEVSVASGTPLTPTVAHVNEKLRKAHTTLALNGITATQEMRRLKEKNLRRSNRDQGTTILANHGPITVYDARLRVAKDLHNRRANQTAEAQRIHKKEVRDEAAYLRRWMTQGRRLLRASLQQLRVNDLYSSQPTYSQGVRPFTAGQFHIKTQHQDCISSAGLLGIKYCLHRELHAKTRESKVRRKEAKEAGKTEVPRLFNFYWNPPFLLPYDYDVKIVNKALEFVIVDEEKRRSIRKKLSLEIDGVEIDEELEEIDSDDTESLENDEITVRENITVNLGEFVVPKDE
jgi:hypothetical protein